MSDATSAGTPAFKKPVSGYDVSYRWAKRRDTNALDEAVYIAALTPMTVCCRTFGLRLQMEWAVPHNPNVPIEALSIRGYKTLRALRANGFEGLFVGNVRHIITLVPREVIAYTTFDCCWRARYSCSASQKPPTIEHSPEALYREPLWKRCLSAYFGGAVAGFVSSALHQPFNHGVISAMREKQVSSKHADEHLIQLWARKHVPQLLLAPEYRNRIFLATISRSALFGTYFSMHWCLPVAAMKMNWMQEFYFVGDVLTGTVAATVASIVLHHVYIEKMFSMKFSQDSVRMFYNNAVRPGFGPRGMSAGLLLAAVDVLRDPWRRQFLAPAAHQEKV